MSFRPQRVSELIHHELSQMINREIEFTSGVLVTVSSVEVDKKLERALVNISVLPAEADAEVMRVLEKSRGYLYHLLFKKLNIKPLPDIMFRLDRGNENAARVEKKLLESEENS